MTLTPDPVHQCCRFLDRCAYDTGYQPATMIEEGERLGKVLGDKDILFMCHHGTLVVADSIHVAFDEVRILNEKKNSEKLNIII